MRFTCPAFVLIAGVVIAAQSPSTTNATPQLQAHIVGTGRPVVLLGGGLLGADGWGRVPAVLARTHRVINVQSLVVQHGLENRPLPDGYSLETEVTRCGRRSIPSVSTLLT